MSLQCTSVSEYIPICARNYHFQYVSCTLGETWDYCLGGYLDFVNLPKIGVLYSLLTFDSMSGAKTSEDIVAILVLLYMAD